MNKQNTVSLERKRYLTKLKRTTIVIWTMRLLILTFFLLIWEVCSIYGIIDPFLFSSPSRIIATFKQLYSNGDLFLHIGTTLYETILGFLIASIIGTIIAVILWCFESLRKIFEPYIVVLNALPKIALGPIIIIAFGSGTKSIIFMTVLVTIIVTVINMLTGFSQTDSGKILLLKSMGANKIQILLKLVLPGSIPTLISTLKVNVGLSWIGSIMGEYIVSKQGLGYLIVYGGQVLKLDLVMFSTVSLCILATLMYLFVLLLQKILVKWEE